MLLSLLGHVLHLRALLSCTLQDCLLSLVETAIIAMEAKLSLILAWNFSWWIELACLLWRHHRLGDIESCCFQGLISASLRWLIVISNFERRLVLKPAGVICFKAVAIPNWHHRDAFRDMRVVLLCIELRVTMSVRRVWMTPSLLVLIVYCHNFAVWLL